MTNNKIIFCSYSPCHCEAVSATINIAHSLCLTVHMPTKQQHSRQVYARKSATSHLRGLIRVRGTTVHEFFKESTEVLPHLKSFVSITLGLGTTTKVVCKQPKRTHHVLPQGWQVIHFTEVGLCLLHRVHAGVDGPHQGLLSWGLQGRARQWLCCAPEGTSCVSHVHEETLSASSAPATPGHFRELPPPSRARRASNSSHSLDSAHAISHFAVLSRTYKVLNFLSSNNGQQTHTNPLSCLTDQHLSNRKTQFASLLTITDFLGQPPSASKDDSKTKSSSTGISYQKTEGV